MSNVLNLNKKILELNQKIILIQSSCQHTSSVVVFKSDTGNYDPSEDSYWKEFTFSSCQKKWSEKQ